MCVSSVCHYCFLPSKRKRGSLLVNLLTNKSKGSIHWGVYYILKRGEVASDGKHLWCRRKGPLDRIFDLTFHEIKRTYRVALETFD